MLLVAGIGQGSWPLCVAWQHGASAAQAPRPSQDLQDLPSTCSHRRIGQVWALVSDDRLTACRLICTRTGAGLELLLRVSAMPSHVVSCHVVSCRVASRHVVSSWTPRGPCSCIRPHTLKTPHALTARPFRCSQRASVHASLTLVGIAPLPDPASTQLPGIRRRQAPDTPACLARLAAMFTAIRQRSAGRCTLHRDGALATHNPHLQRHAFAASLPYTGPRHMAPSRPIATSGAVAGRPKNQLNRGMRESSNTQMAVVNESSASPPPEHDLREWSVALTCAGQKRTKIHMTRIRKIIMLHHHPF